MSEMNGNNNQSLVLEGMYKGIVGKIDEIRGALEREAQLLSAQQLSSFEALKQDTEKTLDSVLAEMRYLAQQNTAIFDYSEATRKSLREELLAALSERTEALKKELTETALAMKNELQEAVLNAIAAIPQTDYDLIAEKVTERETASAEEEPVRDELDYDVLAEKVASVLPETSSLPAMHFS